MPDIKELIKICKTCENRNRNDDMYFMAHWSICQNHCEHMAKLERLKKNFEKAGDNEN